MAAGHDVVEHAHVREQLDVLEGAGDAEPGDRARRQAGDVLAAEADAALAAVDAADAVEGAGLAGAVGADQREQLAGSTANETPSSTVRPPKRRLQVLDLQLSHTTSGCGGIA